MHVYTPAHTYGFTDKCMSALLSLHDQQPICELGFFLFLNKRQICLWPHCALYRIYIQLQKGLVSDELLKPGRRQMSPCLKAQEGQPIPLQSHRGVSHDQTSNRVSNYSVRCYIYPYPQTLISIKSIMMEPQDIASLDNSQVVSEANF